MGMTIQELCHYFWYSADSMEERYAGSCSARGPFFYSYSTTIACHCGSVYMLSEDGFSCTTATKHLAPLRMACPNLSRAIFVPFEYNDSFSSVQACVKTISERLYHRLIDPDIILKFRYAEHRRMYLMSANAYRVILEQLHEYDPVRPTPADQNWIHQCKTICVETNNKQRKALSAEALQLRANILHANIENFLKDFWKSVRPVVSVTDQYPVCYFFERDPFAALCCNNAYSRHDLDAEQLDQYCKQSKIHLSYCIPQSNKTIWRTTQAVSIEEPLLKAALTRWVQGRVSVGQHVGPYEIIQVPGLFAKIGCHVIARWHLEQLAWHLIPKEAEQAGIPNRFPDGTATFFQVFQEHVNVMYQHCRELLRPMQQDKSSEGEEYLIQKERVWFWEHLKQRMHRIELKQR
jgi:hypothetical protein